ncbi:TRAP transporter small permease [Brevibacillus humidisoli]|uniref:TRAP transporter small permease n=1 Tax=Brevibacillus humidisoli TaxID=2895522 RepID=UPI001E4EE2E1|nr:TRAP transporter small permease [Brevibacillus humidisoli]UFJ38904.1 TRAP transporter small permease [Brevibacillus humidisoli]
MQTIKKWWDNLEELLSGSLLVIGLAISLYGVFMRYFMNAPQAWVDEIFKYFVIWGILIGGSMALRNNHHISVDLLYDKFPKGLQKCSDLFANLVGLIFGVFLAYNGWVLVMARVVSGQVSTDVGVPLWIVYLILPLAGVMLGLRFIEKIYRLLKKGGSHPEEGTHDTASV